MKIYRYTLTAILWVPLLLGMILTACAPVNPVISTSTSSTSPTPAAANTFFPTKPPITSPARSTANPPQIRGSIPPSPVTSPTEEIAFPVLTPSLKIGKGIPTSLVVSPDGKWLAVGMQFGVYQYRADTFEQAWFAPLDQAADQVVFDPQSKRLGVKTGGALVILNSATGEQIARIRNVDGLVSWSPDGQRLVSGGSCEQVTVWDANSGAALKELRGGKCSEGYSGISATWGADGRIYAASMGTKILAWDGTTYDPIADFSAQGAGGSWIDHLTAAPSGGLIAQRDSMGEPVVAIVDGPKNRRVHLLDRKVNGPLIALAWAPDGKRLAAAYGMNTGLVLIWNAETGEVEQQLEGFYNAEGLGWSSDGTVLYGPQALDGRINAVEVHTGRVLRSLGEHAPVGNFMTWTRDGLVSTNGAVLTRWDPSSGKLLRQETVGSPQGWVISWPPAGPSPYLFFSSFLSTHQVGNLHSRWQLAGNDNNSPYSTVWSWDGTRLADPNRVWDARTGKLLSRGQDPAQQHPSDQVAWSPDGSRLASAESLSMQPPVIWDSHTGDVLYTLPLKTGGFNPLLLGLAWSPDGKQLAAAGSLMDPNSGADDGMILVWDAQTGKQTGLLTAGMHNYRLATAAWSPDGRFLACGTTGMELFVWDMTSHAPVARLEGHKNGVGHLAWSPDGSQLASLAGDGTLQIWDLQKAVPGR